MTKIEAPSISIDEAYVGRHCVKRGGEYLTDPTIQRLVTAAATMRGNVKKAHSLAEAISADQSFISQHARQSFPDDARKLFTNANKAIDDAMGVALAEIERVSKSIRPPALSDKAMAAEIRERLATLKPEDRDAALGDDVVMSAAANGPSFLSGMTPKQLELTVTMWSRQKHPEDSDRLLRLGKALAEVRRIGAESDKYFTGLIRVMMTPSVHTAIKTKAALDAAVEAVAE